MQCVIRLIYNLNGTLVNTNNKMTTWNKVRNRLYYTNDDYIRDVIAFHMQDNAWDIIHNYIYSQ